MATQKEISKARKLKRLAERGIGGEKDNADKMYKEYIIKHGISDSEVNPEGNQRRIQIKNDDDFFILTNVILNVDPYARYSRAGSVLLVELDDDDFEETGKRFRYFIKLWRIERELLTRAFFAKHMKYFTPDEYSFAKKNRDNKTVNNDVSEAQEYIQKLKNAAKVINPSGEFNSGRNINSSNYVDPKHKDINNIRSDDVFAMEMFNKDRVAFMMDILLESDYTGNRKKIG